MAILEIVTLIMLSPWFIFGLLTLTFWCSYFEHYKCSVLFTATFVCCVALYFSVPTMYILYGAICYIPIGLVWSYYRWTRYTIEIVDEHNEQANNIINNRHSQKHPHEALEAHERLTLLVNFKLNITNQKARITSWVFAWPVSLVENVIADAILSVQRIVIVHCRSLFDKAAERAKSNMIKPEVVNLRTQSEPTE